jgi:tetratricopeptide (TPR) repeat protein
MLAYIKSFILIALSATCVPCFCQSNPSGISHFFSDDVLPTIDPEDFVQLEFDWNFPGDVQVTMNAGLTDLYEKNFASACENFREVQRSLPNFVPANYYLGVGLKAERKYYEAEKAFRQSLSLSKHCWQAHLQLAETLQLQRRFFESEKAYLNVTNINPEVPEPYFNLGHLEMQKGNKRKALRFYEKSTEVQGNFVKGYVMQGVVKMHDELSTGEALTYFNKALQSDSLCKEARFWRGLHSIYRNQAQDALRDWNILVQTNPNNIRFIVFRGFLNIELGNYDEAFSDLRKAVDARNTNEAKFTGEKTLLDKQIDIQLATRYIIRNSYGLEPSSQRYFKIGYCLFLVGRYNDAINAFNYALGFESAAVIFFAKAISHEHAGNHTVAMTNYSYALSLDPEIFEARKKRALYLAQQRDWKGANADLTAMEKLEPESIVIDKLRGYIKMGFKNYYGAIVDLSEFIKFDSTDSDVLFNRGYCLHMVENYRLAADDYLLALKYDSTKAAFYSSASEELLKAKDTLRSFEVSTLRTRRFPKDAAAWVELANVQLLLMKIWEGHASIDKALETIVPKYFDKSELFVRAAHIKGMLYFRQKNYKASIKQFSKGLDFSSRDPESQYLRGQCYLMIKDLKSARKDFEALAAIGYRDSQEIYASLVPR